MKITEFSNEELIAEVERRVSLDEIALSVNIESLNDHESENPVEGPFNPNQTYIMEEAITIILDALKPQLDEMKINEERLYELVEKINEISDNFNKCESDIAEINNTFDDINRRLSQLNGELDEIHHSIRH